MTVLPERSWTGTWHEVKQTGGRVVYSKWLDRRKDGEVRSRLVATEVNTHERPDLFAATPPLGLLRLLLSLAATGDRAQENLLGIYDVSVAFFHSQARANIFVVPPRELSADDTSMATLQSA
eukprot:1392768-Amphidinium_carterae.1